MELVRDKMKELVEKTIETLLKSGSYKDINEIRRKNPSLEEFCFNNNLKSITYAFSTIFTNENYLNLLDKMEKETKLTNEENKIVETNVEGNIFVDYNDKTLVGVENIENKDTKSETFENEEKFEKEEANFKKLDEIDTNKLNNEQLQDLSVIANNAEKTDNTENTQVFFDNGGNMTNIAAITDNGEKSYYTVDNIDGNKDLVNHESNTNSNSNTKAKVKTLSNGHNISSAFTNTLILSFIIGSFFGIVFLAIYTKIMH